MSRRGILLANLGSPDEPQTDAVRRYLDQFLMDPYVLQLPWFVRRLIVSLFILPSRPAASAEAYRSIWWPEGSPLVVLSQRLCGQVQAQIQSPVALGMRYGNPSLEDALLALTRKTDLDEILLIPLYPHFADSTVTTSIAEVGNLMQRHGLSQRLLVMKPFFARDDYIEALYASVREHLQRPYDHILFSYHGLPESHIRKADPTGKHCLASSDCCEQPSAAHGSCYRHQVRVTTRLFTERAGIESSRISLAFQSRLGRAKWLEPNTADVVRQLASQGVERLLVLCPAFVTDCLETLEEIGIRAREDFQEAGGKELELVPCMNDHPAWVDALASWCVLPPDQLDQH